MTTIDRTALKRPSTGTATITVRLGEDDPQDFVVYEKLIRKSSKFFDNI